MSAKNEFEKAVERTREAFTTDSESECSFPLRKGLWIKIRGLPDDLTIRDVERLVRFLRALPAPGFSVEVCACGIGAAEPGRSCPACGKKLPEREREASESLLFDMIGAGLIG